MVQGASTESDPESGSASVLAVTGVGLLAVLTMLGLGARVVVERRAVEDSIADMRAYWAAMGVSTYVLSRVRQDNTNGQPAAAFAKIAIQEVADGATSKPLNTTWQYPDVSASYAFVVNACDAVDGTPDGTSCKPVAGTGGQGLVGLSYAFNPVSSGKPGPQQTSTGPEALRTIPSTQAGPAASGFRMLGVGFNFCMYAASAPTCGQAPNTGTYTLQWITAVNRGAYTGQ